MKNYHIATRLFAALLLGAVLPLCSCEQQENSSAHDKEMLTINATLDGELDVTARSYSGDVSLVDKGFTIVGYLLKGQYAPESMTIEPNVFDKSTGYQAVSKLSAKQGKFKIPLPLIGLGTEDEPEYLSVLAWTQGDTDTGYGITGQTENNSVGMPYLNINLQSPKGKQGDIVAAQKIDHLNDYVITAIDLDFKHILSKMTFVVKNSTATSIEVKDVKLAVAENALYSKAKYTFNGSDSIGIYSNYSNYYPQEEYTPGGWTMASSLAGAGTHTLGELLLIPQKAPAGFYTLKVTYSVNSGASITRTLPLKARDLQAGKNYIYTLDVNADAINVINVSVGGWKEAPTNTLPMVPGECGDVVLLLEGKDEPYQHTDGKRYWLDRSGYNNHCEIVGDVAWNTNNDGYVFPGTNGNNIKIPNLGTFEGNVLCELVCNLATDFNQAYPTPIQFVVPGITDTRSMMAHIGSKDEVSGKNYKNIVFDYGQSQAKYQRVELLPVVTKEIKWNKRAFYAFGRKKGGYMSMTRNKSIYQEDQSVTNNDKAILNNGIIGPAWKGEINYVKIVKGTKTVPEVEDDYHKLKESYKIEDDLSTTYLPAVQTGLVFCTNALSKSLANHTIYNIEGTFDKVSYENKVYYFNGNGKITYSFTTPIMKSQSYTLEIIAKNTGSGEAQKNTIISFHPNYENAAETNRQIHVHLPWDTHMAFVSPTGNRLQINNNNINTITQWHKYNFIRNPLSSKSQFMEIWQDGTRNGNTYWDNNTSAKKLEPITYFTIGTQEFKSGSSQHFTGYIYAIRLYNRALTENEIKINYNKDKTVFNL